jgi:hypothetical protein
VHTALVSSPELLNVTSDLVNTLSLSVYSLTLVSLFSMSFSMTSS